MTSATKVKGTNFKKWQLLKICRVIKFDSIKLSRNNSDVVFQFFLELTICWTLESIVRMQVLELYFIREM